MNITYFIIWIVSMRWYLGISEDNSIRFGVERKERHRIYMDEVYVRYRYERNFFCCCCKKEIKDFETRLDFFFRTHCVDEHTNGMNWIDGRWILYRCLVAPQIIWMEGFWSIYVEIYENWVLFFSFKCVLLGIILWFRFGKHYFNLNWYNRVFFSYSFFFRGAIK